MTMRLGWSRVLRVTSAGVLALVALLSVPSARGSNLTFSGRAFGVQLHTMVPTPSTVTFVDTGNLPSAGGSLSASLASVTVGSALTGVVTCLTQGGGSLTTSSATVTGLTAFASTPAALSASEIAASASATCGTGAGSVTITGLVFSGNAVSVTGAPNQVISIAGVGTLTINEQPRADDADVTVNALHLRLATGDELIVASAHSDTDCLTPALGSTWGAVKGSYR